MINYQVNSSILKGSITIPPSKSHTLRSILFASLASGKSVIRNYLNSPDTTAMIHACRLLGAQIFINKEELIIIGNAGVPQIPNDIIDAGNSGQVLRFIGAIAALTSGYTVLSGDHSIRTNRYVQPLLDGLSKLGVFTASTKGDGYAPIIIKGPLKSGTTLLNGEDSQNVSALLIAAAFSEGTTSIQVQNPGETPWINLTLDWLKRLKISYRQEDYSHYVVQGRANSPGFEYSVPGDFSSAAFPLIAALITRSEITLHNLDMDDIQGDKALIPVLQEMGAQLKIDNANKAIHVKKTNQFIGRKINVNDFIDAVTILAVMGCFAESETHIYGAKIARTKESNRLSAITQELTKMGAKIITYEDGLIIQPSNLTSARVYSHNDHRVAMSLAVAAFAAKGETVVEATTCVAKSFPNFISAMHQLGASIQEHS